MTPSLKDAFEKCVVRIGIFFDGTGKNGTAFDGSHEEMFKVSNIYRLFTYYGNPESEGGERITGKVYIEGIGTLNNEPDSIYSLVTGDEDYWGCKGYGPDSKLQLCQKRVASALGDILSQNNAACQEINIEFDIFGFSRGAVLARHLTNLIYESDVSVIDSIRNVLNKNGYALSGTPVVNFLGLFDTVGAFMDSKAFYNDSHDTGYTRSLKVNVPAGAALHAFQFNAWHEFRYNFPLHSLGGHYPELTIAGAHSDVGGGYPLLEEERKVVSNRYIAPFDWAYGWVEKELFATLGTHKWRALTGRITYRGNKWFHYTATNEREVFGHLQFIAFIAMVKVAEKCGCIFSQDYKKFERIIPDDLVAYCERVLSAALDALEGKSTSLDEQNIDDIMRKYVHLSSTWASVADMFGDMKKNAQMMRCRESNKDESKKEINLSVMNDFWPYRPHEGWQRKIFD